MADNIDVTPGTGKTVATDDVGGVQYQRVKINYGADGAATEVDVASGKQLPVALYDQSGNLLAIAEDAAVADGAKGILAMATRKATPADTSGADGDAETLQVSGGLLWVRSVTPVVTCKTDITRPNDTTAYAAGDNLSDNPSAPTSGGFTLTGAARKSGGSGVITDVLITSSNNAGAMQGELWIFDTSVTNINDNSAFAISDSEIKTVVAKIPFLTVADTNNALAHVQNLAIGFTASGSANLRFLIKLKAAYTPAANEVISVAVKCLQTD